MKKFNYLLLLFSLLVIACNDNVDLSDAEALESIEFTDVLLNEQKQPLPGATVTMFANDLRYSDITDAQGRYSLKLPAKFIQTEGFMSMSIVARGYKPKNMTYQAPLISGTTYDSGEEQLVLETCQNCLQLRSSNGSELFHLGDDNYGGPANSQFQKATDGLEMKFELEEMPSGKEITLNFEAKGLQPDNFEMPASVMFGDNVHDVVLEASPEDGSYGEYELTVENTGGISSITFITRNHGQPDSDYDDWEFTGVSVQAER